MMSKVYGSIDRYKAGSGFIKSNFGVMLNVFFITAFQRMCFFDHICRIQIIWPQWHIVLPDHNAPNDSDAFPRHFAASWRNWCERRRLSNNVRSNIYGKFFGFGLAFQ